MFSLRSVIFWKAVRRLSKRCDVTSELEKCWQLNTWNLGVFKNELIYATWYCVHREVLLSVDVKFIQLYFEKVVAKTVHATIPKGNLGYDQYTSSWHCSCRTYFCCFPLALAKIRPWPLVPFFEISLKNSELKTTNNTFRDCRVHFFRQPFSKQLYTQVNLP